MKPIKLGDTRIIEKKFSKKKEKEEMGLCQTMRNETLSGEGLQTKIATFKTQLGLIKQQP